MVGVVASARRSARVAMAAILSSFLALAVFAPSAARALEPRALAGWWIAIDDTFPNLWNRHAIAPMEEVVEINLDGRVSDRVMNFWAGSPQVCIQDKVCSDLPLIAVARLSVTGNRASFVNVSASTAKLDAGTGSPLIRREAMLATPDWTCLLYTSPSPRD